MDTSSSGIRFSAVLRWAFASIVAVAAMAGTPCLAFADDASENAGDGAAHAAAVVDDDSADLAGLSGDPDESASAHDAVASGAIDQDSSASVEGESTPTPKEDAGERFTDDGASGLKADDSDSASDGIKSDNKDDSADAATKTHEAAKTDKATASGLAEVARPNAPDAPGGGPSVGARPNAPDAAEGRITNLRSSKPVASSVRAAIDAAPNPQFTCLDAGDQSGADVKCESGDPASGGAPTPASPSRSALPFKDAPAPATPTSSWGERHADGGQAYDDLAVLLESEPFTITYRQAPCASSRNARVDDPCKGPKRCRSPSSIGR